MYNVRYLIRKAPKLDDSGEIQNIAKYGVGIQEIIDRLAEYEEAEKHGQIISVVKCRDCKYLKDSPMAAWCGNKKGMGFISGDDFCSKGERKDGGRDDE